MSNQSDPEFNQQPRVVAFPHLDKTTALKSKKLSASDVCLQQANKLCQDGNLAGAIPFYRQALQLKPDSQEACQKLAEALKQQGNTEEAGIYFRQAIALDTMFASAIHNLAQTLYWEAAQDARRLEGLGPEISQLSAVSVRLSRRTSRG